MCSVRIFTSILLTRAYKRTRVKHLVRTHSKCKEMFSVFISHICDHLLHLHLHHFKFSSNAQTHIYIKDDDGGAAAMPFLYTHIFICECIWCMHKYICNGGGGQAPLEKN